MITALYQKVVPAPVQTPKPEVKQEAKVKNQKAKVKITAQKSKVKKQAKLKK